MNIRKYVAEFLGTMILVFLGCGTAMLVGCDAAYGSGYILTAAAFGLGLIAAAYAIGHISGCHINPAVSLAMLINGRMKFRDFWAYVLAQILGAFAGSAMLLSIFAFGETEDLTGGMGANGLMGVSEMAGIGLLVEIILTFIFVFTVLGATSPNAKNGSVSSLVIGLTLFGVHILGIGLTGTSVNPARSIAPAVYSYIVYKDGYALSCLWVFIVGPLLGAAAAAGIYRIINRHPEEEARIAREAASHSVTAVIHNHLSSDIRNKAALNHTKHPDANSIIKNAPKPQSKPADIRTAEHKPIENNAAENKTIENKTAENKTPDNKPAADPKPSAPKNGGNNGNKNNNNGKKGGNRNNNGNNRNKQNNGKKK